MLGEMTIAFWLAKLLETDDGSSTPVALAMIVAAALAAPFGGTHAVVEKIQGQVAVAAQKVKQQASAFPEKVQTVQVNAQVK